MQVPGLFFIGRIKLYLKMGNDIILAEGSVYLAKGEGAHGREDFME